MTSGGGGVKYVNAIPGKEEFALYVILFFLIILLVT